MLDRRSFITATSAVLSASSFGIRSWAAPGAQPLRYRHVVFFNFKDDVSQSTLDHILAGLKDQGRLPYVKGFFMGKNSLPKLDIAPFSWLVMFDFRDEADRKKFLKQDAHINFIRNEFFPVGGRSVSLDINQPLSENISDTEGIKVRQVGLFNFKDGVSQAERDRVLENLRAQGRLPGVKRLMVGQNFLPKSDAAPYEWMFMSEFASEDDNKAWRALPEHKASESEIFGPARSDFAVISVKI